MPARSTSMTVLESVPANTTASPVWADEAATVLGGLEVDPAVGLTHELIATRRQRFGRNELAARKRRSALRLLAAQFSNTMTAVLAVAGAVTLATGERADAVVIGGIVLLNAAVGFVQEHRAEEAMAALQRMTADTVLVRRAGVTVELPSSELVPGDILLLGAGDVIPADVRLVSVFSLRVNEAPLTGESEPVAKHDAAIAAPAVLAERFNMAYKGTAVTYGRAEGVVVATGMGTELGRIAALLQTHTERGTPLQRRLAQLGRRMAAAAAVVCVVVFAVGVSSGQPAERMFITAVSMAVAAIPEGLPAVVTVALALGARRMAERRAIVRTLPAVEGLGSVSVICTDKTGTLTQNAMLVERVWTPVSGEVVLGGEGYRPEPAVDTAGRDDLIRVARVAASCNDATLHPPLSADGAWSVTGDPTEGALLVAAAKLGLDLVAWRAETPRVAEVAFDASRRRMTTAHRTAEGVLVATKGALEALAPRVDGDAVHLSAADEVARRWASEGYRVLALADQLRSDLPDELHALETHLALRGLVAIADPPRPETANAIAACHAAGITAVMITGDDPRTAAAIARRVGLLADDGQVVTGAEVEAWGREELLEQVSRVRVYARTEPEQKLRIVEAWKDAGATVAMTGDGVNDAPALQRADIGVAMGITGTDVSKEAADIVLADDNFATIVDAVAEGRRIYDNLRRFVRYLVTTNTGEIWLMLLAPLFGLPLPLLAVQLLWVNLVTDGLPAVALGVEPAEPGTMRRPPRPPAESIFGRGLWQHALWVGLLMAGVGLAVQSTARAMGWEWRTMVFSTIALLQLGHALAIRSERESLWTLGLRTNPSLLVAVLFTIGLQAMVVYVGPLQSLFGTKGLAAVEVAVTLAASTVVFGAVEIEKAVLRRGAQRAKGPN